MLVQVTREKGLLVWGITIVMIYPLTLLMYTEAGRAEARYLVKWPIFVYFLGQLLGISLTFPAMWLPCVFLGHGTGATSKSRVLTAMPLGTSRMATASGDRVEAPSAHRVLHDLRLLLLGHQLLCLDTLRRALDRWDVACCRPCAKALASHWPGSSPCHSLLQRSAAVRQDTSEAL